jgi:hypothetical protein
VFASGAGDPQQVGQFWQPLYGVRERLDGDRAERRGAIFYAQSRDVDVIEFVAVGRLREGTGEKRSPERRSHDLLIDATFARDAAVEIMRQLGHFLNPTR